MWCLVMFDLPVETKKQRREATRFRNDLLDWGFCMVQFSVYVKYWPTGGQDHATLRAIKTHLPEGGQVRVLALTDRQWATGLRFDNAKPRKAAGAPEQLMIFELKTPSFRLFSAENSWFSVYQRGLVIDSQPGCGKPLMFSSISKGIGD